MTARFEVGDRIQKTGTELIEVLFEVVNVDLADTDYPAYRLGPVNSDGTKLYGDETLGWPKWFSGFDLDEYEKV